MGRCKSKEPKQGITISLIDSHVEGMRKLTINRSQFIRVALDDLFEKIEKDGWASVKDRIIGR